MTLWSLRLSVFVKSFTLPLAYVLVGLPGIGSTGQWSADVSTWTNHAQDNLMGDYACLGPPIRYTCQIRHARVVNTKGFPCLFTFIRLLAELQIETRAKTSSHN